MFAQKVDVHKLKGMQIRSIGPAGMSGRVTSIDAVHAQPDVIYVGTASGGLWKSESGGMKWEPMFDEQPMQSIGAVAIDQRNPSIIWAGGGEGNPRNSQSGGNGIYRSPDGGKTWKHLGLENTRTIHRIVVHPENSEVVWVGANGSGWGPNKERGVFKTTNGGESWEQVLYLDDTTGCADLIIDPSNPDKLFAAMWHYHREPWFFTSGGKSSGLHMTVDGGKTWTRLSDKNGLPKGELGRIGLAIAPSNPKIVYALVEAKKTGLYRSEDGGYSWKKQADKNIGNRPFYYADIYVDSQNENRLYNLHSIVTKSEDGGKTFEPLLPWSSGVHPDHHAFWVHPTDPSFLMNGNDGGMAISRDRGETWRFVENLPLAQFYHINYDLEEPYNVMGGMQDNGSWVGPSAVWENGGIRNYHWQEVAFGDGFDVVSKPGDANTIYAMSQGGYVSRINRTTGKQTMIRPLHPDGKPLRYNWNAAIGQDPFDACTVYFGSQYVHKSTDCGDSWTIISPDLTTNDTSRQKQNMSGGLTIDATQAENYTTILAISPSPLTRGVIWASTDDGRLHITQNGGKSWTDVSGNLPGMPNGAWIPQVEVSRFNAGEAFVVVNDYRRNNWTPYLYHTRDFGKTWRRIADEKKVDGFALSVVQDPVAEKLLFLGTDHGLYFSIDAGSNWNKWTEGFPSVATSDLKIHPLKHDLIVGTFGRAAWILDDILPLRELALQGAQLLDKDFHLFKVQDATAAEYKSAAEGRFIGNAQFVGQNRRRGAMINVWVKAPVDPKAARKKKPKPEEEDSGDDNEVEEDEEKNPEEGKDEISDETKPPSAERKHKDKIGVYILSAGGDTVRTFYTKADTGVVRFYWRLERDGFGWPSYKTPPKRDQLPGGPRVWPGRYVMHVWYQDWHESSTFSVLPDPRDPPNPAAIKGQEEKYEEYYRYGKAATKAFEALRDARDMMGKIAPLMANLEKPMQDSLKKQGKAIKDSIKTLMEIYLPPEGFTGINSVDIRLGDFLWGVRNYLESADGIPGGNALVGLALFKKEVEVTVRRINRFLKEDWADYRKSVEAARTPLFKDLEEVEIR